MYVCVSGEAQLESSALVRVLHKAKIQSTWKKHMDVSMAQRIVKEAQLRLMDYGCHREKKQVEYLGGVLRVWPRHGRLEVFAGCLCRQVRRFPRTVVLEAAPGEQHHVTRQ
jgi:hypothetical protein